LPTRAALLAPPFVAASSLTAAWAAFVMRGPLPGQAVVLFLGNFVRRGEGDPLDGEVLLDVLVAELAEVQRVPLHTE
jgi:hypothetical protein